MFRVKAKYLLPLLIMSTAVQMFSMSLSLFAEFLAYDGRNQLEFVRTRFYELFHRLVIDSRAGTVDVGEILALGEANHTRTGHLITKNGMVNQGQAIGYGRITQFCPLPFWGHYSHVVTVANSMDRIFKHKVPNESNHRRGSASGRLTNGGGRGSRDMIFPLTPQNPILVE